jgi:hypothetical protein
MPEDVSEFLEDVNVSSTPSEQITSELMRSRIELELATTNPQWGRPVTKGLMDALHEEDEETSNWEKMAMYTRDLRLGNLTSTEKEVCQWYIDFSRDCLLDDLKESHFASLGVAVTRVEISQSHNGMLRKLMRTKRQEFSEDRAKRDLFGGEK